VYKSIPGWHGIALGTTIGTASVNAQLPFKASIYQHGNCPVSDSAANIKET